MSIKIVIDSSCDLEYKLSEKIKIEVAPLTIDFDGTSYVDDVNLDMGEFLSHMKRMLSFKTACPSVHQFLSLYEGEEDVLVMTISSKLSASYQSALTAKEMYIEKYGENKKIHIFNSLTASGGQVAVLLKMVEYCEANLPFETIVENVDDDIRRVKTLFVLQSLGNLAKAGRVSPLIAKTTAVLNIRCLMTRSEEGTIELVQKIMGEKRCIKELAARIANIANEFKDLNLCISHCEGMEKVEQLLKELSDIVDMNKFKRVLIQNTRGLASIYADFGGLVIGI